jgi:predicted nucleic acid-binding Zn finger protein
MQIPDIADYWKLLLMMGIGVFASQKSTRYVELMKQMAQEHKLFMIIASTDYIYGTNYQLCHGYIGKDLAGMSQEKCIQAMGRVGRNKLQQDYSVRFRDNDLIYKLFTKDENKPEVMNMNRLWGGLTPVF